MGRCRHRLHPTPCPSPGSQAAGPGRRTRHCGAWPRAAHAPPALLPRPGWSHHSAAQSPLPAARNSGRGLGRDPQQPRAPGPHPGTPSPHPEHPSLFSLSLVLGTHSHPQDCRTLSPLLWAPVPHTLVTPTPPSQWPWAPIPHPRTPLVPCPWAPKHTPQSHTMPPPPSTVPHPGTPRSPCP